MEVEIICYFCYQKFIFEINNLDYKGMNIEVWDCEVCCNPNQIIYEINEQQVTVHEVSSGNE